MQVILADDLPLLTLFNRTPSNVYRPATYDGWQYMYDHQWAYHSKLSYLEQP